MPQDKPELPQIDLSLVTFNSGKWIESFFSSLKKQLYPVSLINVYVRDNGSTDDTLRLLSTVDQNDFHSFHIGAGENVGFGEGHNKNLALCGSDFVLVSNLDLSFENESILRIVEKALNDAEQVASWEFRQKPFEHPKYYNPVSMETAWSSHACILFRRKAVLHAGGYEPKIFMYGEDVELSYRLRANGYALKYFPESVCWHHTYESANETKPLQFLGNTLANAYLRLRYGSWIDIFAILPLQAVRLVMPERFKGQRIALLKSFSKLIRNSYYFLSTRKNKESRYSFHRFDYGRNRMGAFYQNHPMPETTPLVSVIMRTCQGRLEFLKEAVASVLNQTYQNIELVVVEDGSSTAGKFVQSIRSDKVSIAYHPIKKSGRSRAGNVGLSLARGEFLCFLDDDDLFFADHIEVLVEEALAHPSLGAVYSAAWQVKTEIRSQDPLDYIESAYDLIHRQVFSRPLLFQENFIPIQSILFKRELYKAHGGFDESIDYLEDWELWVRFASDCAFQFIPKLTSLYRVPSKSTEAVKRHRQLIQNDAAVLQAMANIPIKASLGELRQYAELMAEKNYAVKIKRSTLRKLFLRLPFAPIFYDLIARIVRR